MCSDVLPFSHNKLETIDLILLSHFLLFFWCDTMVDSKTKNDSHVCTELVVSRGHEVCVSCGKVAAVSVLDSDVPEYSDRHAFVSAFQTVLEPSGLSTVMGRVNGKREPVRPGSLFTATEIRQIKAIEKTRDDSSSPENSRGAIAAMFDHLAAVEVHRGAPPPVAKVDPMKAEEGDGGDDEKKVETKKARKPRKHTREPSWHR